MRLPGFARQLAPLLVALAVLAAVSGGPPAAATPATAPNTFGVTWTQIPGKARDITVAPDGTVWIATPESTVQRWNGAAFETVDGVSAARIAAGPDGTVWVATPQGQLFQRQNNAWQQVTDVGTAVADVAVGPLGDVYVVAPRVGAVWLRGAGGGGWNWLPRATARTMAGGVVTRNGQRMAAHWLIGEDGKVVRFDPAQFFQNPLPEPTAQDIATAPDGTVWITGSDSRILRWTGSAWDAADVGQAATIAVGPNGAPYVVNASNDIWRGDNVAQLAQPTPTAQPTRAPTATPGVAAQPVKATDPIPTTGPGTPWPALVLLCKYPDGLGELRTVDQVHAMFAGQTGLDRYFQEVSYGAMNMAGTRTSGWFALPKRQAEYASPALNEVTAGIARDCAAAAAGTVNAADFNNLIVIVNDRFSQIVRDANTGQTRVDRLIGGQAIWPVAITVNGAAKTYNVAVHTHRALTGPALIAHEVGHLLGGQHVTPGAAWDVLGSAAFGRDPALYTADQVTVGPTGPGYVGANRDRMGWIPANRKVTFDGTPQVYTLARLTQSGPDGMLLVTVPLQDGQSYVVDYRTKTGFDGQLPADAVTIHRMVQGADPVFVTVTQNQGEDASGEGTQWKPGKTFTDQANNVSITVQAMDGNTATVSVGPAQ